VPFDHRSKLVAGMRISTHIDIGAISGKAMDLDFGFSFTSYDSVLGKRKVCVGTAAFTNDIEPIIDGFPLSSYNFIVFDITDSKRQHYLLKLKWDNEMKWFYKTEQWITWVNKDSHQARKLQQVQVLAQTMPSIWVKDPAKVLKIVKSYYRFHSNSIKATQVN
jgi:hypothetical protein